jgi:hypothetical protein
MTAPNHGKLIGWDGETAAGVDKVTPVFNFSKTVMKSSAEMTQAYIGVLYSMTGKTNSASWSITVDGVSITFAAGEVLFLGASGQKTSGDRWEVAFSFAGSLNVTGVDMGNGVTINKKGWEYVWVTTRKIADTVAGSLAGEIIGAYADQVYDSGAFSTLGTL